MTGLYKGQLGLGGGSSGLGGPASGLWEGQVGLSGDVDFAAQNAAVAAKAFAVYDALDQSSMFEDIAGTIPVTAHNQQVGLWLDKKQMGAKTAAQFIADQPEIISNGDFGNGTTGWSLSGTAASQAVAGGVLQVTRGSTTTFTALAITTIVGRLYRFVVDVVAFGVSGAVVRAGTSSGGNENSSSTYTTSGTKTVFFTATATTTYISLFAPGAQNDVASYDNVSIKAVPGYHLGQATGTKRPKWQSDTAYWSIKGDGLDDCLQSITTVNLSATDKVTVVAAQRKLTDAATAMVLETTTGGLAGSFSIRAPQGAAATFDFSARGAGATGDATSSAAYASPRSAVVSGTADTATATATQYIGSTQDGQSVGVIGSGNFANAALNLFSRNNGASLPFSGHISGLIIANNINQSDRETLYWPWANRRMIPN